MINRSVPAVKAAFPLLLLAACGGSDLVLPSSGEGTPTRITIVRGNEQAGAPGTMLSDSLIVRVSDSAGAPLPGLEVEFLPVAPGSAVTPEIAITDAEGEAGARWVLGGTSGPQQVVARVLTEGADLQVVFTASALTGLPPAPSLSVRIQPSGSAGEGQVFDRQPVVQTVDAGGDELHTSGVPVTAAIASGSGSLAGTTTRTTDDQGRARFTDLRIAGGSGPHVLIFAAPGYASVLSTPIDIEGAGQLQPTATRIESHDPDPSRPGETVVVRFSVTSEGGSPAGSVVVTVSGGNESCTATVSDGSCALVLTGTGEREIVASFAGNDRFGSSSDRVTHRVVSTSPDQAPIASPDVYRTLEGGDKTLIVESGNGVLQNDQDPEGGQLTASIGDRPTNGQVDLNPDGSFRYTPESGYYGEDRFTYWVRDPAGNSSTGTVTIEVEPVNDSPRFSIAIDRVTVPAGETSRTIPNFVRGITPGAPNEEGQELRFEVIRNSNPDLFASQPVVERDGKSSTGRLSFTPAAGRTGTAEVTIILRDDGGTANGGHDTSLDPGAFTIRVQ